MRVIALNGPPKAGKDTATEMILEELNKNNNECAKHFKISTRLKELTLEIALNWSLKEQTAINYFEEYKDKKNTIKGKPELTLRQACINLSEDYLIPTFGQHYLIDQTITAMDHWVGSRDQEFSNSSVAVISDLGFDRERERLEKMYPEHFEIWQVERQDTNFDNDSRNWVGRATTDKNVFFLVNNNNLAHLRTNIQALLHLRKFI